MFLLVSVNLLTGMSLIYILVVSVTSIGRHGSDTGKIFEKCMQLFFVCLCVDGCLLYKVSGYIMTFLWTKFVVYIIQHANFVFSF